MGGDFRHTWWGVGGVSKQHMKHFLAQKTWFFELDVSLSINQRRPPMRSPHDVICKISKYDMWSSTTIKNHVFSTISHVFKPAGAYLCDFQQFWASGARVRDSKISPKRQKSMIFVFTFSTSVRRQNIWYESNFFNVSQIYHWNCENYVI